MSKRPISDKKAAKLRKVLRPPTPSYIDLVEYLVDHHKMTKKQAREALVEGKVRVDSHKVGRLEIELLGKKKWIVDPLLPANRRNDIVVIP